MLARSRRWEKATGLASKWIIRWVKMMAWGISSVNKNLEYISDLMKFGLANSLSMKIKFHKQIELHDIRFT